FNATVDLIDADTGEVVLEAGKKLTPRQARLIGEKGVLSRRCGCNASRTSWRWRPRTATSSCRTP
ncbi:hypothetical protein ACIKT0_16855, partial [Hansschlegelia beijingensis]|uniref:hypothetical protein n=1 Tax=Hansschlegelia beijingensis TaxID=1133344 RepID=UPI00387EFFE6